MDLKTSFQCPITDTLVRGDAKNTKKKSDCKKKSSEWCKAIAMVLKQKF